jgi:hypothetical protein
MSNAREVPLPTLPSPWETEQRLAMQAVGLATELGVEAIRQMIVADRLLPRSSAS